MSLIIVPACAMNAECTSSTELKYKWATATNGGGESGSVPDTPFSISPFTTVSYTHLTLPTKRIV